ncbi:MAG: hypothetical protein HFJ02_04675 [Bacilli bacterium]|nr:hypothetical protein [Bacilli bacterium]
MKYKILIIIIIGTLLTSIIYITTREEKKTFLAIGDGLSSGMTALNVSGYNYNDYLFDALKKEENLKSYYHFHEVDETASSLLTKINNNVPLNNTLTIKQAIKEAYMITLHIGMDELNNYARKHYLDSTKITAYLNKYEEIMKIIAHLNNKKIFVLGLFPTNLVNKNKIEKINQELKRLAEKYHFYYVEIIDIINDENYFTFKKNYYPNYKGQEYIFKEIQEQLDRKTIELY